VIKATSQQEASLWCEDERPFQQSPMLKPTLFTKRLSKGHLFSKTHQKESEKQTTKRETERKTKQELLCAKAQRRRRKPFKSSKKDCSFRLAKKGAFLTTESLALLFVFFSVINLLCCCLSLSL
jgi:hypothetical protein